MAEVADYTKLITSRHNDKPRFVATVEASVAPFVGIQNALKSMLAAFDIRDEVACVGVQLDILGLWIGVSRRVSVPLEGQFFTWDDTAEDGWDSEALWQGTHESGSSDALMGDDLYRKVLRGKILANIWKGDRDGQYAILQAAFGAAGQILIIDGQDMTQTILVQSGFLNATEQAILTSGVLPIKPAGVGTGFDFDYDIPTFEWSAFFSGTIGPSEVLFEGTLGADVVFIEETMAVATSDVPFTNDYTLSFRKEGVEFATLSWLAGGTVATLSMPSGSTLVLGTDQFAIVGAGTADDTGAEVAMTLLAAYVTM